MGSPWGATVEVIRDNEPLYSAESVAPFWCTYVPAICISVLHTCRCYIHKIIYAASRRQMNESPERTSSTWLGRMRVANKEAAWRMKCIPISAYLRTQEPVTVTKNWTRALLVNKSFLVVSPNCQQYVRLRVYNDMKETGRTVGASALSAGNSACIWVVIASLDCDSSQLFYTC